jgi:hypothetical protein
VGTGSREENTSNKKLEPMILADLTVIARSASDEAIQSAFVTLDCFASLAMTTQLQLIVL